MLYTLYYIMLLYYFIIAMYITYEFVFHIHKNLMVPLLFTARHGKNSELATIGERRKWEKDFAKDYITPTFSKQVRLQQAMNTIGCSFF